MQHLLYLRLFGYVASFDFSNRSRLMVNDCKTVLIGVCPQPVFLHGFFSLATSVQSVQSMLAAGARTTTTHCSGVICIEKEEGKENVLLPG